MGLQIFGGLIVGMVVKYADNILKNFANALSVIFTVLGAMPLFGQYPSGWFIVGVALVSLSVFMYGKSAPQVGPCFCIQDYYVLFKGPCDIAYNVIYFFAPQNELQIWLSLLKL